MGLADRDYMRQRDHARYQRELRSVPANRSNVSSTIFKILAVAAGVFGLFEASSRVLESRQSLPFPTTGDALWYVDQPRTAAATLTLYAPARSAKSFAVRLEDWSSGKPLALIPVRAGESAVTLVPLGRYRVTIAKGTTWLGPAKLFGRAGDVRQAVHPLEFFRDHRQTMGHSIQLEALNGNMETKPVHPWSR